MREASRTRRLVANGGLPFVLFLGFLSALAPLSIDISLPALPVTGLALHAPDVAMQATLGGFILAFGLGQLVHGPLADRFGRRPVALGGVALFTVAGVACALAPDAISLIAARVVQGFGACGATTIARATARDIARDRTHSASLLGSINSVVAIAPITAPLLGAALLPFGWRAIYATDAVLGCILFALVAVMLPETLNERSPHTIAALYLRFLRLPRSLWLTLYIASAFGGIFAFISGSSFVLQRELGVPSGLYALSFASSAAMLMFGAFLSSRLAVRVGSENMLRVGAILLCVIGFVSFCTNVLFAPSYFGYMIPMALYACANGMTLPNAFAAGLHEAAAFAGTGVAVLGAGQMLGGTLTSTLVGAIPGQPSTSVGICTACAGTLALVAYLFSRRAEKAHAAPAC